MFYKSINILLAIVLVILILNICKPVTTTWDLVQLAIMICVSAAWLWFKRKNHL